MSTADIGSTGVAVSALLVAIAIVVSLWRRLGLERDLSWAAVRALGQLIAVGVVLAILFAEGRSIAWSWAWVAAMIVVAARIVGRRSPEVTGVAVLSGLAFLLAALVSLGVLLGLQVFPTEPRTVVPLAGMVIGNSMNATILATRRIIEEARDKRLEIEARLVLAIPAPVAIAPHLRNAVRTALIPQIETTRNVGIIFLPGAMVGLILAGADPGDAVRVQIAVMYLVLASVAVTTSTVAIGLSRRLVTSDHRLIHIPRPVEGT